MIYLDNGATSLHKPPSVYRAVMDAMHSGANPGRGGYRAALEAAGRVYSCRETAAKLFDCRPEQVVLTMNCTHGLNIAIRSLVKPGGRVVVSGFEHNAVMRPLYALGAQTRIAGRRLFNWEDTLDDFYEELRQGADAAVVSHVSNVFGYILPVEEIAKLCRQFSVPLIVDAAQSAGSLPFSLEKWQAEFIAMPGHKGLLGPQGTGLLLCGGSGQPLLCGGTGSESARKDMPDDLPERLEAGTQNVPGAAGLNAGMQFLLKNGLEDIRKREHSQTMLCARGLQELGMQVFTGPHQAGTVSFCSGEDCETAAQKLAMLGFAVRAGLHCAPLAHESAGTLESGTIRVSFGLDARQSQTMAFLNAAKRLKPCEGA